MEALAAAASSTSEAAQQHETPLEPAAAIRQALNALGCCNDAETCFLDGFAGGSGRLKYYVSERKGSSRSATADARGRLSHVVACSDLPTQRLRRATRACARSSTYSTLSGSAELWKVARASLSGVCGAREGARMQRSTQVRYGF